MLVISTEASRTTLSTKSQEVFRKYFRSPPARSFTGGIPLLGLIHVSVAVARLHIVEQKVNTLKLVGPVQFVHRPQHRAAREALTDHVERDVQLLYKDLELADNAHGGSIDDHLVIPSAQLLYQFRQAWAFEEFKRVWRNRAGRDHVHSGDVRFADDLIHSQLTYQVSAEAVAQLQAQPLMHLWPPHIRIHKQR